MEQKLAGTQSIERAITLLKTLSTRPINGWCLSDLLHHCKIEDATGRRMLKRLAQERLVVKRSSDGRYLLGPLLFELGTAVLPLSRFQAECVPYLARLSRELGSAAFVYLRAESEFVCIALHNPLNLKGIVLNLGTRRSIGLAAGGMSMLLALKEPERSRLLQECGALARRLGEKADATHQNILARSLKHGTGVNINDGLGGVSAVTLALLSPRGDPFAAVGVGNSSTRITDANVLRVLESLKVVANEMQRSLAELPQLL